MAESATQTQRPPGGFQKRQELLLRLRPDVEITEQHHAGETFYVLKDPLSLRYFRISELEYLVASLMDGTNTIEEISRKAAEKTGGLQIPKETISDFAASLRRANLLANTFADDANYLYRILQMRRKARGLKYKLKNILYIKISLLDPDRFLTKVYPYVSFIFTRGFVVFAALVFLLAARIVAAEWGRLVGGLEGLLTIENMFYFWVIFIGVKVIHEMGHAFSCKHYGGEVHEMGLLFLVFTPCMFTNVSDAWTFKSRRAKFVTSLAGIGVEVFMAAFATLVWAGTFEYPGVVHELSYKVMILCSITSVIFNGNPLMKFDGYYILSDYFQLPNLRVNSMRYVITAIKKYLLQIPVEGGELSDRTNRLYFFYGILATLWLISVMSGICVGMLKKFYLFGLWMTFFTLLAVSFKLYKGGKYLAINRGKIGWSGRTRTVLLIVLAIFIYFFFFFPISAQVTSTFVLQPKNLTTVTVAEPGRLAEIEVEDGQWVEANTEVLRLENKELEMAIVRETVDLRIEESYLNEEKFAVAVGAGWARPEKVAEYEGAVKQSEAKIKEYEKRKKSLTVKAPVSGYAMIGELKQHLGRTFIKGEGLMEIGDPAVMTAEIKVEHQDFGKIDVGQRAVLRIKARGNAKVEGRLEAKSQKQLSQLSKEVSAEAGGHIFTRRNPFTGAEVPLASVYEATVTVPNSEGDLRKGMTGNANIYYGRTTIANNIWTGLINWLKDIFRL
jgi:putative peptide zinc metalloprotease protein